MTENDPLTIQELKQSGALYISRIQEAFGACESITIEGSEEQLFVFLKLCIEKNEKASYVDFYYGEKSQEEQKEILSAARLEERAILEQLMIRTEAPVYLLTKENLPLFAGLTAREAFFSTFYFTGHVCTVWGNYGRRYVVFFNDKEQKLFYSGLARGVGLRVE